MNAKLAMASALLCCATLASAADRPVRIVNEGMADKDWAPASPLMSPPTPAGERREVCVSIGYRINRDGSTSDLLLLRVQVNGAAPKEGDNVDAYAQSAAAAVSQWKFAAKPDASSNRVVYTAASFGFPAANPGDAEAARKPCAISDLKDFIAKVQADKYKRGNMTKADIDRSQRENSPADQALRAMQQRNTRGF